MSNTFTAVFQKTDKFYIGYIEELPGANTQGETLDEVRENLREAVEMVLLANRELSEKEVGGKNVIREELVVNI